MKQIKKTWRIHANLIIRLTGFPGLFFFIISFRDFEKVPETGGNPVYGENDQ